MNENEAYRFGKARFATAREAAKAGLHEQADNALFFGYIGKKPVFYSGMGGALLVAGARSGKLTTILAYNACYGIAKQTLVILDIKGEIAAISQYQVPDDKYCIYWNPLGLHGLPQHRINPVDYIRKDSLSLVSDVKVLCQNLVVASGSAQGVYFEGRAQEILEGVILGLVEQNGVLTLPDLYHAVNLIPGGGDDWLEFGFEMSQSAFPIARRVEEEIATSRESGANSFSSIMGEIYRALAPLSDPVLLQSVSPPFDFSMAELCASDRKYQLYLMPPAEMVQPWAGIVKSLFVAGMIYKSRAPHAPRQTWIMDECGQLGKFPMIPKLYTYGAGIGIQPFAVFQNSKQMNELTENGAELIASSAALSLYFAVRDLPSAEQLSRMLGAETLEYDDSLQQSRAALAKSQAAQAFISGGDPFAAVLNYRHHKEAASHRSQQRRMVRNPDEVIQTSPDKGYAFVDGMAHPLEFDRRAYFNEAWMAGRFLPNPYHPPLDSVRVKSRWGHRMLRVRNVPTPANLMHFPQYAHGRMRILET
ncbi:MAG: type IV secretory system conjugative DNA transfer family protein [Alphaproteobacteria bacterium]